ncbi:MAG TPA: hypothetical protein VFR31_19255 [Thermoanaerobaculia bacterium]|nr:hypothetical protein [Thermoanaerobaculia bacterium]
MKDAEQELKKVEETIAMADRIIQISRHEQERIASDLPPEVPESVETSPPAVDLT